MGLLFLIKIKWPLCMEQLFSSVTKLWALLPNPSLQTIPIFYCKSGIYMSYPGLMNQCQTNSLDLDISGNAYVSIQSFFLNKCASASSSGLPAKLCLEVWPSYCWYWSWLCWRYRGTTGCTRDNTDCPTSPGSAGHNTGCDYGGWVVMN